jgi:hypothetical protein
LKSGEFATEAPSKASVEWAAAGLPEEGKVDSLWEADKEAILLVILWEWLGVLEWPSSECGCITRCVWRWEQMWCESGRKEYGLESNASRRLSVFMVSSPREADPPRPKPSHYQPRGSATSESKVKQGT